MMIHVDIVCDHFPKGQTLLSSSGDKQVASIQLPDGPLLLSAQVFSHLSLFTFYSPLLFAFSKFHHDVFLSATEPTQRGCIPNWKLIWFMSSWNVFLFVIQKFTATHFQKLTCNFLHPCVLVCWLTWLMTWHTTKNKAWVDICDHSAWVLLILEVYFAVKTSILLLKYYFKGGTLTWNLVLFTNFYWS